MISHLVVSSPNHEALRAACARVVDSTHAGAVHIIDRNGVGVTHVQRDGYELDVDILSSLVSGNVATANAMASLIGESEFKTQVHQGDEGAFLVTQLGPRLILIVWFDDGSSLGLVQLAVKKIVLDLVPILADIDKMSGAGQKNQRSRSSVGCL